MAQYFSIHPVNPQLRLVRRAAAIVRAGGVIAYPTDSSYALGCRVGDLNALERIRALRQVDERHHLTLVCRDLADTGGDNRRPQLPGVVHHSFHGGDATVKLFFIVK